jgi:hypothetical protein
MLAILSALGLACAGSSSSETKPDSGTSPADASASKGGPDTAVPDDSSPPSDGTPVHDARSTSDARGTSEAADAVALHDASATDPGAAAPDARDAARDTGSADAFVPAGPTDGGNAPADFWDSSNVMMFKFLNRTNGKLTDGQVYWRFKNDTISELHSIAEQATYDMPANSSGRMYFYLCVDGDTACAADPTKSKYFDFIEHTIGATQYNGNTTRVDAFGLKIAMRLHCADGYDAAVGEDYATFQEDRAVTFQKFINEVPAEFQGLAQAPNAPYRIVAPGAGGFDKGGQYATYYDSFVDQLWAANGLTVTKPGPNGGGLGSYPDLSAAIYRHVGAVAGTFDATGKLLSKTLWADASTFYQAAPANYYALFWHNHALGGKAYGFPYDDVGSYSSYISHAQPQYLLVAIGW